MQAVPIEQRWEQFTRHHDPALRDQLILQYAPLVKYVVGRMVVSLPGLLSNEDILSYGTIGLIQAVDRFDPSQGVKFETYAIRRIRGAILDAIRSLHPISRDANRRAREIEHAYDTLVQQLGRLPTDAEVSQHLGVSLDELHQRLADATATILSLDSPLGDEDEHLTLLDQLADDSLPSVAEQVERNELYRRLVAAIRALPERDRLVITLYYYEELTLKEISEVLGVSTSRVSQLHAAAVLKLRAALRHAQSVV
ncbi:MAG TPA: FliA/WhiG family RNA polymerase sigma factor [Chloroflexota bacterium]|jgi:RNA polymerase sigma factor for flagellar operon FliA|nr:FliA/WhiG family RNA polymerase sigma factor [Chloroflexota bacterium]